MGQIVIAVMAFFLVVGALDKAFFNDRFGFGDAFQQGLNTMGPLTLAMVGIMCAAPSMGTVLGPLCTPFFEAIGSDPSMIAGIFFGVDAGGLALAKTLAGSPDAMHLFGIGLSSTLGCILLFPLPFSLSVCKKASQPYIAKGIAAALIASPFSLFGTALVGGIPFSSVLKLGALAFAVAVALAAALVFMRQATIRVFIILGQVIMSVYALLLAAAALEKYFGWVLIPGMAPISPQLAIVGEIGIMLAGAYPMVHFVKRFLGKMLNVIARLAKVDGNAALGMFVSLANPLPMYTTLDTMSNRGKVLCSAFAGPAMCAFGDHLGFMEAYYPEGITMLIAGKLLSAFAALAIAIGLEKLSPSPEQTA